MYNPGQEISSLDFGAIIGGSLNAVIKAQSQSANTTVDFIKAVGFQKKLTKDENGNTLEENIPINVAFTYDKEVSPAEYREKKTWQVKVKKGGQGYAEGENNYKLLVGDTELPVKQITVSNGEITDVKLDQLPDTFSAEQDAAIQVICTAGNVTESAELTLSSTSSYDALPAVVQKMQIQVPILTMMPIPFIKIEHADIDFNVKINSVSSTNSSNTTTTKADGSFSSGFFYKTSLSASFSNQKESKESETVKKDYSLNISIHAVQDDIPAGMSRILDMLEESITAKPIEKPKEEDKAKAS